MRLIGARFLAGPNLHDDASGVVIRNEMASLPPAGAPLASPCDRSDAVFAALGIAGLADDWAATVAQGRAALPAFLLRLAAALATRASTFPSGGRTIRATDDRLVVFLRCEHETIGLAAWDCAGKAVLACLGAGDIASFEAALAFFRRATLQLGPDLITADLARAARRLDLPWYRLKIPGEHVQLGQGIHRRYMFEALTDGVGAVSRLMSQDKFLTNRMLGAAGVPVLPMMEVSNEAGAVAAAERLGYPVVVKPCHGGQGRAVGVHLTEAAQVAAAYRQASADRDSVVVEKFAAGHDHRILVVGGRMIGAARRVPAHVVGDGRRSVAALVEALNLDPRRGLGYEKVLVRVDIDAEVEALLAGQGLSPDSVPENGRHVALKRTANVSTGGTAIDVTDAVHPDNRAILERAATALELSVVGIDFLSEDIGRSWREAGGVVLEANALPGLRPHWLAHPERNVAEPILRSLLPPGSDGRIPTCAITGSVGKTTTANMVARILGTMGLVVGLCTTAGVTVGDERRRADDCAGGWHARNLLFDRRVEAGVFELARGGLLNEGMVIDECDVGAVLNIYDNHIGSDGIANRADLARIKSIVARRARRMLVLNAEDPLCLAMPQVARAERLCLVAKEPDASTLRAHIEAGGAAVMLGPGADGDTVRLVDRGVFQPLMTVQEIPATIAGRHGGKVWNAMFAAAIAHAMGASLDHIRHGLRSFKPDIADSQGRVSIIDRLPFNMILDHSVGQEAARELANLVRTMSVTGRKRLYVMASGKRSDEFLRATGRALAGAFDAHVCTNSASRMRPDPMMVPALLRDGLIEGGVPPASITCIAAEEEALRHVLQDAGPGDLIAAVTDETDRAVAIIEQTGRVG
jgi:cyanophycin synthetase